MPEKACWFLEDVTLEAEVISGRDGTLCHRIKLGLLWPRPRPLKSSSIGTIFRSGTHRMRLGLRLEPDGRTEER
jgi:hypothetical protein